LAFFPWVLHLEKANDGAIGVGVFNKGFDNHALTRLKPLEFIEALCGDHMLLPKIEGE